MVKHKVFTKDNITLEPKVYEDDIGIDIRARSLPNVVGKKLVGSANEDNKWSRISYIEYETDIFLDPLAKNTEEQVFTLLFSRSSVSKKDLMLCNGVGVIDPNYRDSIKVRFKYDMQPEDLSFDQPSGKFYGSIDYDAIYKMNDLIGQIIFARSIPVEFIRVPYLSPSTRGEGKFGHTDTLRG